MEKDKMTKKDDTDHMKKRKGDQDEISEVV